MFKNPLQDYIPVMQQSGLESSMYHLIGRQRIMGKPPEGTLVLAVLKVDCNNLDTR